MNKQEIIKEVKHRLELYKTIKPEEFNFGWFVYRQDTEKGCGTICCLWGWEPKLTGVVEWVKMSLNHSRLTLSREPGEILKWGDILSYLYYNTDEGVESEEIAGITGIYLVSTSVLPEVLSAWEKVIELLEAGDSLDEYLNLD